MSTTPDIFLSYNREDQAAARLFAEGFARAGFDVWWDVTLKSGEDYDQATEQALRGAKAVVVLWSPKSVASRWVRTEATIALQSKTLVPVMIAPCQRPIMFELSQTAELGHWKGDGNDKVWLSFVSDVQQFVGKGAPRSVATPQAAAAQAVAAKPNRNFIAPVAAAVVALAAVSYFVLRDGSATPASESANTVAVAEGAVATGTTTADAPAAAAAVAVKSIAVLPFANLSNDAEQEYFSDGLTDELINKLSQVRDLQVTGRNSSFYFKGRAEEVKDIGQQLGVAHLLQGSVRKSGTQLRITAQLLDVNSNANLWSRNFDVQLSDIFMVQDEISSAVTTALSITLRAGEFNQQGMTGNVEAYDEYMMGRKLTLAATNGTPALLQDAIAHYEKATALDPDFAVGWLALRDAYGSGTNGLPPSQTQDFPARMELALGRAKALAPEHPTLLLQEATTLSLQQYKFAEAERLLVPLLDNVLNTDAGAAQQYAVLLWVVGRTPEALYYAQQARRLEPLQWRTSWTLASMLLALDRKAEADAEIERGLTLEGGAVFISGLQFLSALQSADKTAALAAIDQFPDFGATQYALAERWRNQGDAAALDDLRKLVAAGDFSQVMHVVYRQWAAVLGDPQLGLQLLRKQTTMQGDIWMPLYSDLRKLPEFKGWVRERGLLDYWRSTGNWGEYCKPLPDTESDFECI